MFYNRTKRIIWEFVEVNIYIMPLCFIWKVIVILDFVSAKKLCEEVHKVVVRSFFLGFCFDLIRCTYL